MPLFSIITATYNASQHLGRLLASVAAQTGPDWEHLVQDNLSTDQTMQILAEASHDRLKVCSEKDSGVYDAWNRAVARASGEWCLFLGADDFLLHGNVLRQVEYFLKKMPGEILFAYGILAVGKNGKPKAFANWSRHGVFSMMQKDMGLPFPSTFVRTDLLKRYGFDSSFRIVGDFDLCASHVSLENLARLPVAVSFFETGGLSNDPKYKDILAAERDRVLQTKIAPRMALLRHACMETARFAKKERDFYKLAWLPEQA